MLSLCDVKTKEKELEELLPSLRPQRTIGMSVSVSGKGLFLGLPVTLRFIPAQEDAGIVFRRVDLPQKPLIYANVDSVSGTPRCTILGKDKAIVQSVEHVLSAVKAFGIDNLVIEIDGPEIPIGDGSALTFIDLLEKASIVEQNASLQTWFLTEPLYWSEGDTQIIAIPSKELRFSYTLSYTGHPLLDSQFYTFVMDKSRYIEEIAPCRTFSLYEEILPLLESGAIKGGSLDNGVIIQGREIMNTGGARFSNEMARHKILDLIGDTSLIGFPCVAHFLAVRSGHYSNVEMARKIVAARASQERQLLVKLEEDSVH